MSALIATMKYFTSRCDGLPSKLVVVVQQSKTIEVCSAASFFLFGRIQTGQNSNNSSLAPSRQCTNGNNQEKSKFAEKLGQVRLGQVWLGQVRLGQVRLGWLGQIRVGQVRLNSGDGEVLGSLSADRLDQVGLGQVNSILRQHNNRDNRFESVQRQSRFVFIHTVHIYVTKALTSNSTITRTRTKVTTNRHLANKEHIRR